MTPNNRERKNKTKNKYMLFFSCVKTITNYGKLHKIHGAGWMDARLNCKQLTPRDKISTYEYGLQKYGNTLETHMIKIKETDE